MRNVEISDWNLTAGEKLLCGQLKMKIHVKHLSLSNDYMKNQNNIEQ